MSNLPNFEGYSDEKLSAAQQAIGAEMMRRARIAAIPGQIREQAREYLDAGGDPSELTLEQDEPT